MGPRKEKAVKAAPDEALDTILSYLQEQRRPYATQDVVVNLHNKVPKAQCQKILNNLVEQNLLVAKSSGKQTVYHVPQNPRETASQADLDAQDEEIRRLQDKIAVLKAEEKSLKTRIAALDSASKTDELEAEVQQQRLLNQELEGKIADWEKGNVKQYSSMEVAEIKQKWKDYTRKGKETKLLFHDVWAMLIENLPEGQTVEELVEELGLELD